MKKTKHANIGTIIENWSILNSPKAHFLIDRDFSAKNLTTVSLNNELWSHFFEDICAVKKEAIINNDSIKNYNELRLSNETNENGRITIEFRILSELLPAMSTIRKGWKPTLQESTESILKHIEVGR